MLRPVLPLVVCLALPGSARAQPLPASSPWSVSAIGGLGRTWNDESQIGLGALVGVRADARLAGPLRLEGGVDWLWHDREGVFRSEGRTALLSVVLRYRFGEPEAHGYVLGGPVLALHSGTTGFEDVSRDVSSRDPGVTLGGGFAARLGSRAEVGPEARFVMLWADDGSAPAYALYGGVRIAFR